MGHGSGGDGMVDKIFTGCSNGSCTITGTRKGMHTNGGCRCVRRGLDLVQDSDDYDITERARRELESLLWSLWSRVEKAEAKLRRNDGL